MQNTQLANLPIIEPFDPVRGVGYIEVAALWNTVLGNTYPMDAVTLANALANPVAGQRGRQFIALVEGRVVGFIGTQINQVAPHPPAGFILCIVVHPEVQRRGIGSALIHAAMAYFREVGVARVMSGGKYPRIFPGVPSDLPIAAAFFEKHGWLLNRGDADLGRDLRDFTMPPAIQARIEAEGVTIAPGTAADSAEVLELNNTHFAGWADTYKFVASLGDYQDFLVVRDPAKGIIGSLIMVGPGSHPRRPDAPWKAIFGANIGGMGEVGIAPDERKRGLGLAMCAVGAEVLRARGVGYCHIGFTSLVDFYGKLGWTVWREYRIGWKEI